MVKSIYIFYKYSLCLGLRPFSFCALSDFPCLLAFPDFLVAVRNKAFRMPSVIRKSPATGSVAQVAPPY